MKTLVESCFRLDTKLLNKDLSKARNKEPVEGYLNILNGNKSAVIDYRLEYDNTNAYLVVIFGAEPQRILLSEEELTFGARTYLTCACGYRTNALYLHNGSFACRKCHKLSYQSTAINRSTKHGQFLYQQSQILKLMAQREQMERIFYRSQYTKRFMRWLELCNKAGLIEEVKAANELMLAINSQQ